MKRIPTLLLATAALAVAAAALVPGAALAHPLGNFTINHHAAIELSGRSTYVHVTLDLAEIPTVQIGKRVRSAGYPATLAKSLRLVLDGRPAALRPLRHRLVERAGAGGLATLRLDVVYVASGTGTRLEFRDDSFADRIGWREVTLSARDGASVVASDVPAVSASDALRAYPDDLLRSPLDIRSATADVRFGDEAGTPPMLDPTAKPRHDGGKFEALIARRDLSAGVVLLSLLVAAFWGAAHALTPGHGKALVAGYLIGTRGRPRDAFLLGATVTVTHTIGVFALGLVTLALSAFIVPEQLYPWLTLVSGLLVVGVGGSVLVARLRRGSWADHHHHGEGGHHHHHHGDHHDGHHDGDHDDHHHDHDHDHGHQHDRGHHHHRDEHGHHAHDEGHSHRREHVHDREARLSRRGIVGVGVAAGLLPCLSALVVLLAAIALHRVGFGLALIGAFSLGLAATITAIGLAAVLAQGTLARRSFDGRIVRALPALSALAILCVGIVLTARAVPGVI